MQKLIETEIKRLKPVMAEIQFEGVPFNKIIDVLTKHLVSKINQMEIQNETEQIKKPQNRPGP